MRKAKSDLPRGAKRVCPTPDASYAQEEDNVILYSELNAPRVMDLIDKLPDKRGAEVMKISGVNPVEMAAICEARFGKTFQQLRDEAKAKRAKEIGRTKAFVEQPIQAEFRISRGPRDSGRRAVY